MFVWCWGRGEGEAVWFSWFLKGQEAQPRKQLPSLLLSYSSDFEASLWLRLLLGLLRIRLVPIRYGQTGRHYSKKLCVLSNSIYMITLITVLLSLLEGRRKVFQTSLRSELQHRILLTCVQFSLENSRLSKADRFSNTAALFHNSRTTITPAALPRLLGELFVCACFFILFFHLVTFVFF